MTLGARVVRSLALAGACAFLGASDCAQHSSPAPNPRGDFCPELGEKPALWISAEEARALPISGPQWDARGAPWSQNRGVYYYAQQNTTHPVIGDLHDNTDVYVLAKALVWLRLSQEPSPPDNPERYRAEVQQACLLARGTEFFGPDKNTLALGRNLLAYVLAANLIEWNNTRAGKQERDFRQWVDGVRTQVFSDGGTVFRTLIEAHEQRPNNWGLMCGASRLAAAIYLCDEQEEARCWDVFRRWLGDTSSPFDYQRDDWGDLSWHSNTAQLVGINPFNTWKRDCGSTFRRIGGAMPDELRRAGPFLVAAPCELGWSWPAYAEHDDRNYNWNAMQAVLAQAVLHSRRGRSAFEVGTYAIGRAIWFLYDELEFPVTDPDAGGDDHWQPHLANQIYPGLALPEPLVTKPGDQVGYTDWTTLNPSWP